MTVVFANRRGQVSNRFHPCCFPGGTSGKEPACQCRRHKRFGLIPGSGRSSGGGHGNPLQCSCLENPWTEEPGGLLCMGCKESDRLK